MLELKLVEQKNSKYIYHYFPEGNLDEFGEVSCDSETGKIEVVKLHPEDTHERYAYHVWSRLKKYRDSDDYLEKDMVAWG